MTAAGEERLDALQRWFHGTVADPAGIEAGVGIDERIRPSSRLAPADRMAVYANAYIARLSECLEAQYPALRHALGEDAFEAFARAYLEEHPSTHWSLDGLGAQLADFLARTRPARTQDEPDWADLLAELAELEWTVLGVFDGPGVETREVLDAEGLGAIDPERFAAARLELAPSVVLKRFRFPLHEYYGRLRDAAEGETVPLPAPAEQRLAFHRLRYRVYRYVLAEDEHALLEALQGGATVGEAIERASAVSEASDDELAGRVSAWFQRFTGAAFFVGLRSSA